MKEIRIGVVTGGFLVRYFPDPTLPTTASEQYVFTDAASLLTKLADILKRAIV